MGSVWGKSYKKIVLNELKKNCRRSDRDISKTINIHPSTVGRIRNSLEEQGNIIGYTVCRDYHKANYQMSLLCIRTNYVDNDENINIVDLFEKNFEKDENNETIMIDIYESYGIYDFVLTVATKDQSSLRRYINKLKFVMGETLKEDIDIVNISKVHMKNEISYKKEKEVIQ